MYGTEHDAGLIEGVIEKYTLNEEQTRAFKIVAHHALQPVDQLKMYLGGMAGTGKTQVIKAISYFFETRNEKEKFVTMAPTGAVASHIGGSTYHSVLGLNGFRSTETILTLNMVKEHLSRVEYVFFDEVLMLDCLNMYMISHQMCLALERPDEPFGGLNVIFAGDFV